MPDSPSDPEPPDLAATGGDAVLARPSDPRVADAARAGEARRRLHERGIVPVEPDVRVGAMLGLDEELVAVRRGVAVERRRPRPDEPPGVDGDLYVTTRRLLHLGRMSFAYDLEEIREAVVAGDQLLLVLDDGMGLSIAVGDPSLLRVEIAAARAAARDAARSPRR